MNMTGAKRLISKKTLARLAAAVMAISGAGLAPAQALPGGSGYVVVAPQDLQQVVAPVALYPDALLAQTMVASTYPQDVVAAAQWLRAGGDPAQADYQPWDDSVKGLVHDPDALYLLADNYDWMNELGAAFLNQRADTMAAVQLVRQRAYTAGELTSNTYQTVIDEDQAIQIIPANPEVIYVPVYQPQVIFEAQPVYAERASFISFGVGIEVGTWLRQDCDWHDHDVYVGDWGAHRPWWEHPDFDHGRQVNVYVNNRPGRFVQERNITKVRNVTNVRNVNNVTNVNVQQSGRWEHDARKPAPQVHSTTSVAVPQRSVASHTPALKAAPAARPQPVVANQPAPRPQLEAKSPAVRSAPTDRPQAAAAPVRRPTAAVHQSQVASAPVRPAAQPAPAVHRAVATTVAPTTVVKSEPVRTPTPAARPAAPVASAPIRPSVKAAPARQPAPVVRSAPQPSRATVAAAPRQAPAPTRSAAAAPTRSAPAASTPRASAPAAQSAGHGSEVRVASARSR